MLVVCQGLTEAHLLRKSNAMIGFTSNENLQMSSSALRIHPTLADYGVGLGIGFGGGLGVRRGIGVGVGVPVGSLNA